MKSTQKEEMDCGCRSVLVFGGDFIAGDCPIRLHHWMNEISKNKFKFYEEI